MFKKIIKNFELIVQKDSGYYGIIKLFNLLIWVFLLKVSTSLLSPENLGSFFIVFTISTILASVVVGWQSSSFLRFYHEEKDKNKLFFYCIISIIKTYKIILFFYVAILLFLTITQGTQFIFISLVIIIFQIFYSFTFFVTSIYRIKRIFSEYIKFMLIQLILVFATLYFSISTFGWYGILISLSLGYLFSIIYFLSFNEYPRNFSFKLKMDSNKIKEMYNYGLPVVFISIFTTILSGLDQVILKFYNFDYELGIYASNYSIAEKSIFVILSVYVSAFTPILFKKSEEENFNLISNINKGLKQFLFISIPVVLILIFFSQNLSQIFLEKKYVVGHWIIPVVSFASIFVAFVSYYSEVLTVLKKTRILALCYGSGALINLILNLILIPFYGLKAAVFSTVLSYLCLFIVIYIVSMYYYKKSKSL